MALPTLTQLRRLVYAPLRDDERSFVDSWFVDALLNEAYVDLVARLRLNPLEVTSTTSATGTITVPTDYIELIDLWVGTTPEPVGFVVDPTFQFFAVQSRSTDSILGRMDGASTIETYPAQVSKTYTLRYVARPVLMDNDTDTPVKISEELCIRIVNYARAYAKWQEGETADGDRYMSLYVEGLPAAPWTNSNCAQSL